MKLLILIGALIALSYIREWQLKRDIKRLQLRLDSHLEVRP